MGQALPPSGSSVMAMALVLSMDSGGLETSRTNFPLASGITIIEGMGLAPLCFGNKPQLKNMMRRWHGNLFSHDDDAKFRMPLGFQLRSLGVFALQEQFSRNWDPS